MERAGNFLGGMLRQLKRPEAAVAWLSGVWPSVVGKTLARHTRPVRCHKGCLEVAADGKAWRKQLEEMKDEFCTQVNKAWGSALVREVKFVPAKPGPQHISHELNNEHTPFIRRRKA
jgi:predicted nucleic acid-binding Zn ribbon protein